MPTVARANHRLRDAVEHDGRRGYQIAVAAGMSPSVLSGAMTGRLIPTPEQAAALARVLGHDVEELFS